MEPNRTCLLLTPLLLPIIIWLAEMLTLLRKNPLSILAVFQDSAQHERTIDNITRANTHATVINCHLAPFFCSV